MTPTQEHIRQLARGRVLVIGDVMVDHYVTGRVSRVSDEAPVPIVHVERRALDGGRRGQRCGQHRSAGRQGAAGGRHGRGPGSLDAGRHHRRDGWRGGGAPCGRCRAGRRRSRRATWAGSTRSCGSTANRATPVSRGTEDRLIDIVERSGRRLRRDHDVGLCQGRADGPRAGGRHGAWRARRRAGDRRSEAGGLERLSRRGLHHAEPQGAAARNACAVRE